MKLVNTSWTHSRHAVYCIIHISIHFHGFLEQTSPQMKDKFANDMLDIKRFVSKSTNKDVTDKAFIESREFKN